MATTSIQLAAEEPKARDAGNTRAVLLREARRRFARDGYSATTVREIAADAGVNVALINRYFTSKEGLFEACIARAGEELVESDTPDSTVDRVVQGLVRQVTGFTTGEGSHQLLLLLRTSGDERAEKIRRDILHSFSQRMAATAGWYDGHPDSERLLLRAQIVMSTALGMVQLRSTTGVEPLTSATEEELSAPLRELVVALLG